MQIEYYKFFMLCYKMEERLKKMKEEKFSVGNRVAEETDGSLVSLESE